MKNNAKKMRAVNPDGNVFELTRIGKYPNGDSQLIDFIDDINRKLEFGYPNLKAGSIEYQLKKADLAIEKLGENIEYIHYTN